MADRFERADRNRKRIEELHEFASEPRELYADVASFTEDHGVLRIEFRCTRPDAADETGHWPHIPVSRIAIPLALFRFQFDAWGEEQEAASKHRST
ncbi:hypothetical protein [Bradyrhizobium sp. RDM4]|uniref:hypothetical protein n=1 Tax=Bradyrhizobium sp. RDM4 TaxID=3378765 RepID=UPI0038FC4D14